MIKWYNTGGTIMIKTHSIIGKGLISSNGGNGVYSESFYGGGGIDLRENKKERKITRKEACKQNLHR